MKQIDQGDIYLVNLNPVKGHEQAGLRPALVLQQNTLNRYLNTIIISPITSSMELNRKLTTHFLPAKTSGLKKDSLALIFQIRAIDKSRFIKKIGYLDADAFFDLKAKLMRMFW